MGFWPLTKFGVLQVELGLDAETLARLSLGTQRMSLEIAKKLAAHSTYSAEMWMALDGQEYKA